VIGVVSDSKNAGLDAAPAPQAFVNGRTWPDGQVRLIFRVVGNTGPLERALTYKLRSTDESLIAHFETLEDTIGKMSAGPRFNSILLTSFAGLALLIAAVGVYGVLAFAVTRRKKEFGIRMALGAQPQRVLGLVLGESAALSSVGLLAGFGLSFVASRYLKTFLYGVSSTDPRTFGFVALVLTAAALVASLLPARRAASLDPASTLRDS
jgi:putative ABC transport system permease protein